MKNIIITILALISIVLTIDYFNYEEPIEVIKDVEVIEVCDLYVWHRDEKLCVTEKLKSYIEGIEVGEMDRLKSRRGVIRN